MSHNGMYRAKYKKLPSEQRTAKSMVDTTSPDTESLSTLSDTPSSIIRSREKVSAPHLTCYYKSDSNNNIVLPLTTLSNPPSPNKSMTQTSDKKSIPENDVTKSPKKSSMTNSIIAKPRTDSVKKYSVDKRNIGNETSTSSPTGNRENNRKPILNRSMTASKEKKEFPKDTKLKNEISHCSPNTVCAVTELERKLSDTSTKGNKLKKTKSVKFNLKPVQMTKATDSETVVELNPRQQVEGRQVLGPASSNQISNDSLQDPEQGTTFATFFSSFLGMSWPPDVNLNPIPAITRSSTGILFAAYDIGAHIVRTGLDIASSILNDGVEEPREDIIHYNGITIRTSGRELMLHSVYVNCQNRQDVIHRVPNRRRSNSSTSNTSVNSCTSFNNLFHISDNSDAPNATGSRNVSVRIVVEVTNLANSERAEHFDPSHGETRVICDGSRWTLIYGSMFESVVEIQLPNTIPAESLKIRGPIDGIIRAIVIDVP